MKPIYDTIEFNMFSVIVNTPGKPTFDTKAVQYQGRYCDSVANLQLRISLFGFFTQGICPNTLAPRDLEMVAFFAFYRNHLPTLARLIRHNTACRLTQHQK